MKRARLTEEKIVSILKANEHCVSIAELARQKRRDRTDPSLKGQLEQHRGLGGQAPPRA